ncbi:MAG: DUF6132 family protein [Anaeromyxobacteraceae bacterium]
MTALLRRHWRTLVGVVAGAIGGALYSHFIGCRTGTCAITSNPWRAAIFFGIVGAIALTPSAPPRAREPGAADPR